MTWAMQGHASADYAYTWLTADVYLPTQCDHAYSLHFHANILLFFCLTMDGSHLRTVQGFKELV